jgi:predicted transglutaminase-like cysteine proteinase
MPLIVDRIRHSARQGLSAIAVAAYVLVFAAAVLFAPVSALAANRGDVEPLVLESYPEASPADAPAETQAASTAPAAGTGQAAPIRLFGTVEFRSPIKNLPRWEQVRDSEAKRPTFVPDGLDLDVKNPTVEQRWVALRDRLKNASLEEKAREVNRFFNQWPYKTDMELWGLEDHWTTPRVFIEKSGDCEEYAITKYYALRELGVPAERLRIAAVRDTIRNLGHAVLIVFMDDDAYVLDNLTNLVLSHRRLTHYAPQFSINEDFLWRHVVPKAAPPPKK